MAKAPFMPKKNNDKLLWLQNFASKLSNYADKYGITHDELVDMREGADYFGFWLNQTNQCNDFAKKMTQFNKDLQYGIPPGSMPAIEPVFPILESPPPAVPPGLISRAAKLGSIIKKKANYTKTDGNDLGLEGPEMPKDMENMKPSLTIKMVSGGKPQIGWKKQGSDSIEIQVDRGDGNFVFLTINTATKYIDTAALPAGSTTALWKYKAIYRYNNVNVGQWSDVTAVTVS